MFEDIAYGFRCNENADPEADVQCSVRPTRMAFCTKWTLHEDELEIADEFESVKAGAIPLGIDAAMALFVVVWWDGILGTEKPTMAITTPCKERFRVILPALKPFLIRQVQVNTLNGFVFRERGIFSFVIELEGAQIVSNLTVL